MLTQVGLVRGNLQFANAIEEGTSSKHDTQASTLLSKAPSPLSQYWYCIVAFVWRTRSVMAIRMAPSGPAQVWPHWRDWVVALLNWYWKRHQSMVYFMLTGTRQELATYSQSGWSASLACLQCNKIRQKIAYACIGLTQPPIDIIFVRLLVECGAISLARKTIMELDPICCLVRPTELPIVAN